MSDVSDYYFSPYILLVQGLGYFGALVFSLVVCVPMAINQDHFRGHCLLFSIGEWQEPDGQFRVDWASQAFCNFVIFVAVVTFVMVVGFGLRVVNYARKRTNASFLATLLELVANAFLAIMTLIASLFVTFGFKAWCSGMTKRFDACWMAAGNPIDVVNGINSTEFNFHISTVLFGIWGCFLSTFTTLVLSTLKLCRSHHPENLRVSMGKERKRLINEDLVSEVPTRKRRRQGRNNRERHDDPDGPFEVVQDQGEAAEASNVGGNPAGV